MCIRDSITDVPQKERFQVIPVDLNILSHPVPIAVRRIPSTSDSILGEIHHLKMVIESQSVDEYLNIYAFIMSSHVTFTKGVVQGKIFHYKKMCKEISNRKLSMCHM